MSSWLNRCVQPLVAGADQPRRTAAAFAIGTFLSFSPFFGLQIATGMAIAFALRINRAAMFVGLCTNLPWVMIPWYTLTTILGARMLGLTLPADLGGRLSALVDVPVYRAEFWTRAAGLLAPFLWAFVLGSIAGAIVAGIVAYVVSLRFLTRMRPPPADA